MKVKSVEQPILNKFWRGVSVSRFRASPSGRGPTSRESPVRKSCHQHSLSQSVRTKLYLGRHFFLHVYGEKFDKSTNTKTYRKRNNETKQERGNERSAVLTVCWRRSPAPSETCSGLRCCWRRTAR